MSWPMVHLHSVAFFQEGPGIRNWQFRNDGIKLINVKNIVKGQLIISNSDKHLDPEEVAEKYSHFLTDAGDLVMASSGATWGKTAWIEDKHLPLCMNTSMIRFKSLDSNVLDIRYLRLFLDTNLFKHQMDNLITGSAQPNFGSSHLKQIKIPLPTLAEQKRIAAILDKAGSLRRKNQQAIQLADQFLRAMFLDMFGDPVTNPKGWDIGKFKNICQLNPKAQKYDNDLLVSFVPMQRVSECSSSINLQEIRPYVEVKSGFTSFIEGDVLFAKITPCMENGKAGIAQDLESGVGFGSTEFHVFRPNESEYAQFIYSLVHLKSFRKLAANNFSGAVGHKRVPNDFLEKFALYLPPFDLVKKYSNLFIRVQFLLKSLEHTDIKSSDLFNSLSQKAFAGEL